MNVLIISLFGYSESGRVHKIAAFTFNDDNVSVVTSDFNHGNKAYYVESKNKLSINPTRLHVPSYNRNLSLKRLISHICFAKSLNRYLKELSSVPDLVYCAMPTSTAAYVAGRYCKKYKIPFVIDVIDLWPDSLIPIVPMKKIIDICVTPWRFITNRAYKLASYISGESKKYSEIAHNVNPSVPYSYTYLGVDSLKTKELLNSSKICLNKPQDEVWIGYGGSLGQSYDFDVVLEGLKHLNHKEVKYKMWFVGDGEKAEYIRKYADEGNLQIEITGRLEYKDLLKYLSYCDIAINAFKPETLVVHSYKFNDYIATGCYVLNNLSGETAEMITKYKVGDNFDSSTFNEKLLYAIKNWKVIKPTLHENIDKLKDQVLETSVIYAKLKENILKSL